MTDKDGVGGLSKSAAGGETGSVEERENTAGESSSRRSHEDGDIPGGSNREAEGDTTALMRQLLNALQKKGSASDGAAGPSTQSGE